MNDYVWYVCYGSNLLRERFLAYIWGGKFKNSERIHHGCSNKELPLKESTVRAPFELYFSKEFPAWENKAACFLKSQKSEDKKTLCRAYLVKSGQFFEIVSQENGKDPIKEPINIDLRSTKEKGFSFIGDENSCQHYGRILYLGEKEGKPMFSFTAKWDDCDIVCSPPGDKYLSTIMQGLKESFSLEDEEIVAYLAQVCGIKNFLTHEHLVRLIKKVREETDAC